MAQIVGRQVELTLSYGDGREYKLESGLISSIEISQGIEDVSRFSMDVLSPSKTVVSVSGIAKGNTLEGIFNYTPNQEKIDEAGLVHGDHYCRYCGSDWIPDGRGNCGACGGSKEQGKARDGHK